MILTVTLNTALDVGYRVPRLERHGTHRVSEVRVRPGGKGLNVARVLAALGHDVVVTGFAGGRTGEEVRTLLARRAENASAAPDAGSLTDALVAVGGETRRTVAVIDDATGDTTQLNEPGPHVAPEEWTAFLTAYRDLLAAGGGRCRAVALCGSLPPGVPVGAYGTLVREARTAGVPVLLDTSGEPLRRGLAARPDVVKPNVAELAGITGTNEPLRAAREARRRGAREVAASLGPDGMLALTEDGVWRAAPARRLAGNPAGAGDSAVAGLLSGLVEGLSWPDRLVRAVALSAATVAAPAAGEFDAPVYAEMLPRVEVTERTAAA
ncbi:1-phosphofructokinase family hexose kinase [Streptomyces sp. DSM 42041]|uniref:1-phosphofructokinase family hexose kinase n=1 Tax=Streptomyces hazeniae TaxID=3075538 RepID=A0ABU2NNG0_9ACTN|nr:1-phosphofructokinase family hexose kinase [Streptomyces sp. DSM 42041]MDT0378511.1 1-phosphofructokinase family hexose kinase [Streptomyces sp. DSM 42041]